MLTLPKVTDRAEQAYGYMNFTITMDQIQAPAMEGFPALFAHLVSQNISVTGAPFYNYRRIDMSGTLDVEAGVPVEAKGQGNDHVHFGTLPAGRFVGLTWIGHPDQLMTVTAMLIGWVRLMQLQFDVHELADGDHFGCRLEVYETDPDQQPDMEQWVTHLAFKLKD